MKIFYFIVGAFLRILEDFILILCYCGRLFILLWKIVDKIGLSLGRNERKLFVVVAHVNGGLSVSRNLIQYELSLIITQLLNM